MLKNAASSLVRLAKAYRLPSTLVRPAARLQHVPLYRMSSEKGLTASEVPEDNLKVVGSSATVGDEQIDYYRTEGSISILDKVPGVKSSASGQLYVLSFRCNKCNTQSIRSFTKHAYHKGVVLVKCGGCPHTHLVADNLGWFQDTPINLDSMYKDQVHKVHDHVAIVKFLNKAFGEADIQPQAVITEGAKVEVAPEEVKKE